MKNDETSRPQDRRDPEKEMSQEIIFDKQVRQTVWWTMEIFNLTTDVPKAKKEMTKGSLLIRSYDLNHRVKSAHTVYEF